MTSIARRVLVLVVVALAAVPGIAPAPAAADGAADAPAPAAAPAVVWSDDIEAASKTAAAKGADLLVLFSGSDWSPATRKFETDVTATPEFAALAKDHVFVRIDFPRTEEGRAKVRSVEANEAVATRYGVDGVPAVLFLLATGEAWARLDFDGETAAQWTERAALLREKTRPALFEAMEIEKALPSAKGDARTALVRRALEALEHSYDASMWRPRVFAAAAAAAECDADGELGLLSRAMYVLTDMRAAPPALRAAARRADPKNALALRERAVFLDVQDTDEESEESVKASLRDIESLLRETEVVHDWIRLNLCQNAALWSWRVTREPSRAKLYARMVKGIAKAEDEQSAALVKAILDADGKWEPSAPPAPPAPDGGAAEPPAVK